MGCALKSLGNYGGEELEFFYFKIYHALLVENSQSMEHPAKLVGLGPRLLESEILAQGHDALSQKLVGLRALATQGRDLHWRQENFFDGFHV